MHRVRCEGWWEQAGFGRQSMEQLEISYEGSSLHGTGTDIVGPFQLEGVCEQDHVAIVKQYIAQHHIEYYGTWDGEGTLHGHWGWGGFHGGEWLIRIRESNESEDVLDITESLVSPSERSSTISDERQ